MPEKKARQSELLEQIAEELHTMNRTLNALLGLLLMSEREHGQQKSGMESDNDRKSTGQ